MSPFFCRQCQATALAALAKGDNLRLCIMGKNPTSGLPPLNGKTSPPGQRSPSGSSSDCHRHQCWRVKRRLVSLRPDFADGVWGGSMTFVISAFPATKNQRGVDAAERKVIAHNIFRINIAPFTHDVIEIGATGVGMFKVKRRVEPTLPHHAD